MDLLLLEGEYDIPQAAIKNGKVSECRSPKAILGAAGVFLDRATGAIEVRIEASDDEGAKPVPALTNIYRHVERGGT